MEWQLQEAKAKFSELVQKAIDEGPQTVTRHGKEVVVIVSAKDFARVAKAPGRSEGAAGFSVHSREWIWSDRRTMAARSISDVPRRHERDLGAAQRADA